MKTLIISINSKYIHASLAPWYLKAACGKGCGEVLVIEHTINENINDILTSIYLNKPDVAAFSCYIWNIPHVLKLAASLKKILPGTRIVFGGPEVSYDAEDLFREHSFIDYILTGEGEESFPRLIRCIYGITGNSSDGEDDLKQVEGLAWRQGERVTVNAPAYVKSLDSIPSPYSDEMLSNIKNRIVYFEASRGCPYSCSYCLSSASEGTRFFSLARVFTELDRLVEAGARQIKFVDRTFNCNKVRAMEIIRHIIDLDKKTADISGGSGIDCNFHFEVGADLFDEELLQVLSDAPKGLFQIEAGIQTVNEAALAAVNRKTDLERLFSNLNRLHNAGNIHIHTDLIAGLPYEDYCSFGNSFDRVYNAEPGQLQLGFLKFLKGTRMRKDAIANGYSFNDYPPYEILSGKHIRYDELIMLKGIAELVDRYYNSARFDFSIKYLIGTCFASPFRFYESFSSYFREKSYIGSQLGTREMFAILDNFASKWLSAEKRAVLRELIRMDFLASDQSGTLPEFMERRTNQNFVDKCFAFLREKDISNMIPKAAGLSTKQVYKKIHFDILHVKLAGEVFPEELNEIYDPGAGYVYLFNYLNRDKVTGRYPFHMIDLCCQNDL